MKGIQINNYFNNHITLNNKKLAQPLPITTMKKEKNKNQQEHLQPQPNHIAPHNPLNKSPPHKSHSNHLKKRTNTLVELKRQVPEKRSISTERHRNATSNRKKEEAVEQSSQKQEQPLAHMSSRKLNMGKGGLGKRSKSTIIKTSAHVETNPYLPKKQSKKINSNPTNESLKQAPLKSKRKKSSKGSQIIKQNKMQVSQSTLTSKFLKKQQAPNPHISKQSKRQKLTLKIDKILQKTATKGQKKTSRKTKQTIMPLTSGSKKSKPLSARQKKSKQSRFIEQLKERYQNQPIFINQNKYPIKLQYQSQSLDNQFLSVMTNLQKVLNSVGSKQKLKKQLQIINNKLNQFRLHSKSHHEFNEEDNQQELIQISNQHEMVNRIIKRVDNANEQEQEVQSKMKQRSRVDQHRHQGSNLSEEEQAQVQQWDEQAQQQQEQLEQQSQALSDIKNVKPLEYEVSAIDRPHQQIPDNSSDEDDLYLKLHREQQKNPLINKKHNIFFIEQPNHRQSPEQQQNLQRRKQIQLLKRFKVQSAKMLQKVGINQIKGQSNHHQNENQDSNHESSLLLLNLNLNDKKQSIENNSGLSQSISNSSFKEDRYPLANSLSPKFDQHQMISAISLKEQFLSSKHDKMSQLVKKMFEKQLVSPKSYEFQIKYLNKKYQEQNLVLQSFKKQAEQLSSMLSQIKKDKEQIKDIDELIRNEKWEQAQKLVIKGKAQIKKDIILQHIVQDDQYQQRSKQKNRLQPMSMQEEVSGWQRDQGWQRVYIQKHEIENNQFVERGELTNRRRSAALSRLDIDQQCGHTQQSEEILYKDVKPQFDEECIYYNEENDEENMSLNNSGGLIRLVQIPNEPGLEFNDVGSIINQHARSQNQSTESIDRNNSNLSAISSQVERKGFTTNLYFIKEYCIALCQFVRDNQIFKNQFKTNVSKPLQFNLQDNLKTLRSSDLNYPYLKRQFKSSIPIIISSQFNNQYESLKFHSNNKSSEKYQFEKDQELNFVKMICDALNESLDYERPGGVFGKALPWKSTSKHLKNYKHFNKDKEEEDNIEAYDLMFGVAIARIIQWGSCLCGFLPDTVQLQNTQIDDNYVNHIRQSRMAFLLQKMMAEQQLVMTNFQLQETQIYYHVAELIEKEILKEVVEQFAGIVNN